MKYYRIVLLNFLLNVLLMSAASKVKAGVDDPSVFAVNGQPFTFKQLTGRTAQNYNTEFMIKVKKLSNQVVIAWISRYTDPTSTKGLTGLRRTELEALLWKTVYFRLLDQAIKPIVVSAIVDKIVAEHRIKLDDYFNMNALENAYNRELGYLRFRYQHQGEPKERNAALLSEATKRFRLRIGKTYWDATDFDYRSRPFFVKWTVDVMEHTEQWGKFRTKSLVLNALLKDACNKGIYYEKARNLMIFNMSVLKIVDIENYVGSEEGLQNYLNAITPKNGNALPNVVELKSWLNTLSPQVKIQQRDALGSTLTVGSSIPLMRIIYQPQPNVFRFIDWVKQARLEGKTAQEKTGLALYLTTSAYKIAAEGLAPNVDSRVAGWSPDVSQLTDSIAVDGPKYDLPEVIIDPYIRKKYTGSIFREIENNQQFIQEVAVNSARAVALNDEKMGQSLIKQVKLKLSTAKSEQVVSSYKVALKRLESAFGANPVVASE